MLLHIIGRCRLLEVLHEDNGSHRSLGDPGEQSIRLSTLLLSPDDEQIVNFLKQDLSPRGAGNIHDEVMNAWHITIVSVAMRTITVMINTVSGPKDQFRTIERQSEYALNGS